MGSDDVIEILKVISTKPNATIEECRPLKVKVKDNQSNISFSLQRKIFSELFDG